VKIVTKTVYNKLPSLAGGMRRKASREVRKAGKELAEETKAMMHEPKTGLEYPRGDKTHRASAPGESPAIDYGYLLDSITMEMLGDLAAAVYTENEAAEALEFGSVFMEARPFFGPAAEIVLPEFLERMKRLVEG
jgi:hypothetical protein